MDQVSSAAAALLHLDSAGSRHHAGWLARLEPRDGPLDVAGLRDAVRARLAQAPRLRQALGRRSGPTEELVWSDARGFDVADHVVAGPDAPMREDELREAVDEFLAAPLARERPLWRVLVVPRTRTGGAVVVGTMHRALVDGQDASLLEEVVFDPQLTPSQQRSAADRLALDELRAARQAEALGGGGARIGATLRRVALSRTVGPLVAPPPSFLDGARGPTTLVTARADLGRLTRIADHTGASVHDVVLAVAAGTLRRLAIAGGDPEPADLRALVPLQPDGRVLLGDGPCAVLRLPVGERHAGTRLRAVREAMDAAGGTEGASRTTVLAGPPEELASRLALGARVCNVTIPSARGPARARRIGGVRVRALFAIASVPEEHALALSTLSYDRHLHVTATADANAVAGIGRLPVMLVDSIEELGLSTGARDGALRVRAATALPPRRGRRLN